MLPTAWQCIQDSPHSNEWPSATALLPRLRDCWMACRKVYGCMAEAAGAEVGRREADQVQLSFPLSLQAAEVGVPVAWEAPCTAALVDMQQTLRNREHLGPVGGRNHCGPPSRSGEWEPRGPGHGDQAPATTSLVAENRTAGEGFHHRREGTDTK